jgi:hypothetical protein
MQRIQCFAFGALLGAAIAAGNGVALAAEPIGQATTVEKDVSATIFGRRAPVVQNDSAYLGEVIETHVESLVRFRFLDDTQLFVGPSSTVRLDSFVYNPDNTAAKLVIKASKGAFRFISGKSAHEAYEISTPYGSLGVSGTTLGFVIDKGRMIAVLKQGGMVVCPHARLTSKARCISVTQPDMAVIVDRKGATGPVPKSGDMRDFGDICGALCKRLFPQ